MVITRVSAALQFNSCLTAYEAKNDLKPKSSIQPKDGLKPQSSVNTKGSFKDEAKAKHERNFWIIQAKAKKAKFSDLISGSLYFDPKVLEVTRFEYEAYDFEPVPASEIGSGNVEAKDTKLEDTSSCIICFLSVFKFAFSIFSYCTNYMFSVFKVA